MPPEGNNDCERGERDHSNPAGQKQVLHRPFAQEVKRVQLAKRQGIQCEVESGESLEEVSVLMTASTTTHLPVNPYSNRM